jgi:hypothetical protein
MSPESKARLSASASLMSPWTLQFRDPHHENLYQEYWHGHCSRIRDSPGAAAYFGMVAIGGLVRFIGGIIAQRPCHLDGCDLLLWGSLMGPLSHLLLLHLIPAATYQQHRKAIILAYRCSASLRCLASWFTPCLYPGMCSAGFTTF